MALALAPALLLAACNNGVAAPPAKEKSYVLVTQIRPESLDKFFGVERGVYKLCVAAAELLHEAVKPFPTIPPDFVESRVTYANDGQRDVKREVTYWMDEVPGASDKLNGCALRIFSRQDIYVTSGGQVQHTNIDHDGTVTIGEPQRVMTEPFRTALVALHTRPKVINGVQLKCSDTDTCIVDPALVLVREEYRPVYVSKRLGVKSLVLEPVSLVVGKPVDPALFLAGPAK
ncbi:hypothetical protein [Massilia sp. S19_KUP03_FR1]|uniref:hypothetical protein n=1 Tax=Massilia sp. S19_KUP03_FR1 TaxID=3025503 RepID=UPI002FCCC98B